MTTSASAQQGHPVAVGETATLPPRDQLRVGVDELPELSAGVALAHPRHGDERDQLRDPLAVARDLETLPEEREELALATHELGLIYFFDVHAKAGARLARLPDRSWLGNPLALTASISR